MIYDKYKSGCLIYDNVVYIPTSEIVKTFDVFGYMDEDMQTFNLKTINISLFNSTSWNYDSTGPFLFFSKYDVDMRAKVKMISINNNVPISSQWNKNGYEYPIQIAQYGLSHYSKWGEIVSKRELMDPLILIDFKSLSADDKPNIDQTSLMLKNQKYLHFSQLSVLFHTTMLIHDSNINRLISLASHGNMIQMNPITEYVRSMPKISSDLPELYLVGSDWIVGSGIHFHIDNDQMGYISLIYMCGPLTDYRPFKNVFVYSMTSCTNVKLVRNLYVDIIKMLADELERYHVDIKSALKNSKIMDITIYGKGSISSLKLSNQFSYEKFIVAADWFVSHQDSMGGWSTNVTRRIYPSVSIDPGWYSSMAQGHGLSLLIRAYKSTKKTKYLQTATKALKLFEIDTKAGGVATYFLGNKDLVWYEEYPTHPSLFVLNGFMYSLFGLIDYTAIMKNNTKGGNHAAYLLGRGMKSLKTLLPLFDSGFGSFYDLRHLTFPAANKRLAKKSLRKLEVPDGPNRARWEYHIVHIEQLMYLAHTSKPVHKFLMKTANRFIMYLKGYRSSHN